MGVSVFKAIRSPFAKFIYMILAAAFFIGFGILTAINPTTAIPKIKYGDEEIYSDEFFLVLREFRDSVGDEEQIKRNAFDMLLARKAIAEIISGMGLNPDRKYLLHLIVGLQGQDYINLLRSVGATKRSFENYIHDSYLFTKFQDLVVRALTIGDLEEYQNTVSWVTGLREVAIAEIKKSAFVVRVSKREMRNYYLANQSEFKIPETRTFWIAKFPSAETAYSFFNSNKYFKNFDEFEKAVGKNGKATEVIIGKDKATDILAEFFAENITEGALMPPRQVQNEWWVVFVAHVSKEKIMTFKEAMPKIKEKLIAKKLVDEVEKFIRKVQSKTKSIDDFESVFSRVSKKIEREKFPGYLAFLPIIGSVPGMNEAIISDQENFIFPKPVQKDEKIYVVFLGKHYPSQGGAFSFIMFDAEKFIQDAVVSVLSQKKISPPSRSEAIKVLTQ